MAEATIDSLKLEISSSSDGASEGLNALTKSLKKLQSVTSKGLGLTAVVNELKAADTSIKSSSLDGLTKAVDTLSKLGGVKISSSIGNQITAISTALQGANFDGGAEKMQSLVTALEPLGQLGKSNLSSYATALKKLPDAIAELDKIDMNALGAKIKNLAAALKPLGDEMQKVANGFSAFPNKIQKLIASTNKLSSSNYKASTSYLNLYAQLTMARGAVRSIAATIKNWINLSSNYTETMNLFTVSMGQYAEEAYNYAQIVSDAMGIDPAEWMESQGIFMTLTKGFGVAGDRANTMSQQLTQLGYDLASFFNDDVEEAMTKLQSGIAGELEPLRRWGYDLSQAKLEATALSLGIDKAVSSMTQAEKAELRYYAIMTQVTDAHGDMARTLNAPANQLRILKAQVTQLGRTLGNFFIPLLNKVLPYAIAAVKVMREVLDVFMDLLGIELADVDFGQGSITSATNDIVNNLEDGQTEAKKLKSYMLGFDELNVLNTDDGSNLEELLGSGFDFELPTYDLMDGIVATQVDDIVKKMKEWLGITGEIDSWSDVLQTRLGKILELVGAIGVAFITWKIGVGIVSTINTLYTMISNIRGVINAIAGSKFVGWLKAFTSLSKEAGFVETFKVAFPKLTAVLSKIPPAAWSVIAIIAGLISYVGGLIGAIKDGIGWIDALAIAFGSTLAGAGIGLLVGGPWGALIGAIIGTAVGLITDFTVWLWQNFESVEKWFNDLPGWAKVAVSAIAFVLTGGVAPLIAGIIALIKHWDEVVVAIKNIPDAVAKFFADIPNKISGAFESIDEWVTNLPTNVKKKLDEMGAELDALPAKIKKWFANVTKNIKKRFSDLWKPIKDYDWNGLGQDIGQWFGNAVKNAYIFVTQTAPEWFEDVGTSIENGFKTFFTSTLPRLFTQTIPQVVQDVADFFKTLPKRIGEVVKSVARGLYDVGKAIVNGIFEGLQTVWQAIKDFVGGFVQGFADALGIELPSVTNIFAEMWTSFTDDAKEAWNGVKSVFATIGDWMNTHVVTPVANFFSKLWGGIVSVAQGCWNGIESVFSPLANWFAQLFESIDQTISDVFYNIGVIAKGCWTTIKTVWAVVASWFDTTIVTPITNFFSKMWDNLVSGAKSTWEGIKSAFITFGNWVNTTIIIPVGNFFTNLWSNIVSGAKSAWEGIKSAFVAFGNWTNTTVITPVVNFFTGLWSNVVAGAKGAWEGIKSVFSTVGTFFKDTFTKAWQGVVSIFSYTGNIFVNIKDGIVSAFKYVVNGLINGINNVIALPFNAINKALTTIRDIRIAGLTPFSGIKTISVPQIPTLAEGGMVNTGGLFIAREAGPELVGSIGNRTTVMNNDQIVESVSAGVYQAVLAALGGNNDEGGETNIVINLDGEKIYENQQKIARGRGYNMGMGAFSFG